MYNILGQSAFWIINKKLASLYGLESALIISDLVSKYDFYKKSNQLDEQGYFFIVSKNIENETGLSYRRKQYPIINKLREEGILYTKRIGMPSKLYVKVNFNKLSELLGEEKTEDVITELIVEAKPKTHGKDKFESKEELLNAVEEIYVAYPSRCVIRNTSTGKTKKNKDKIQRLLYEKTKSELIDVIKWYVKTCKDDNVYMKNFSTFLNNLPEIDEPVQEKSKEKPEITKLVKWLSSNYMMKSPDDKSTKVVKKLRGLGYKNEDFLKQFEK